MSNPAVCEINQCGVLAIGRCHNCGLAFCGSHQASGYAGTPLYSNECAPCNVKLGPPMDRMLRAGQKFRESAGATTPETADESDSSFEDLLSAQRSKRSSENSQEQQQQAEIAASVARREQEKREAIAAARDLMPELDQAITHLRKYAPEQVFRARYPGQIPKGLYGVRTWYRWYKAAGWAITASRPENRIGTSLKSQHLLIELRIPFDENREASVKSPHSGKYGIPGTNWGGSPYELLLDEFPDEGIYEAAVTMWDFDNPTHTTQSLYADEALRIAIDAIAERISIYEQRLKAGKDVYLDR
ncbi:hypothetical protein [Streptomyces sp. UG1]|uniref:hypothetical protein n=1 Tax=Streptomyces sp. UG1 TaxID=3417652 RepID=UPI003CF5E635